MTTEVENLDHIPPHLRGRVTLSSPSGALGFVRLADLVAAGHLSDPDPEASRAWKDDHQ